MALVQPNFSKGEISPDLYGRIDTSQYNAALKRARNFLVQKYGGVTYRPGTRVVGKVDDPTQAVKLLAFQFSLEQSYVLVMQNGSMRPVARGGFVVEQDTKITGIALGATTALTIPFHGYAVGERVFLSGITGTTELNGRFATVLTVPDADTIEIDVDSTGFTPFVSSLGVENTEAPAPAPEPPAVQDPYVPPADPDVGGGGGFDYRGGGPAVQQEIN